MKSPNSSKPYGVVVGLDNETGIQTARILANHEIPVAGFAKNAKHWACKTNAVNKLIIVDINPETNTLVDALVSFGKGLSQKAVLFPCWDDTVHIISCQRDILKAYYHIALPSAETVGKLMDKASFSQFARAVKLHLPKTIILNNKNDAEKAQHQLSFPAIIKPSSKTKSWVDHYNGHKAHKVSSIDNFLRIYDQCSKHAPSLIVQEWIPGGVENLYSCIGYFNSNSKPFAAFVSRKLRQWFPEMGDTSLGEECRNDTVLNKTLEFFLSVGYHGLGYVEFKKNEETGEYFILEANIGRPTGRSTLAEDCGIKLLYTKYCDQVGLPLPGERAQKHTGRKWINVVEDFHSAYYHFRCGNITITEWWQSIRGPKTYAVLSMADLSGTMAYLFTKMIYLLQKPFQEKSSHFEPLEH